MWIAIYQTDCNNFRFNVNQIVDVCTGIDCIVFNYDLIIFRTCPLFNAFYTLNSSTFGFIFPVCVWVSQHIMVQRLMLLCIDLFMNAQWTDCNYSLCDCCRYKIGFKWNNHISCEIPRNGVKMNPSKCNQISSFQM